jgi:hypothetical protein
LNLSILFFLKPAFLAWRYQTRRKPITQVDAAAMEWLKAVLVAF